MKSFSTTFLMALLAGLFCGTASQAQSPRQVIIANGGVFGPDNMATVAAWNPQTNNYFVFDSIPAGSVQDVVIEGNVAWVAADSTVRAYDIVNYTRLASAEVQGVRKLAVWKNSLIATRGFPVTSDYVKILDKNSLAETASISDLPDYCEGVVVVDDSAYVAVPGNFMATTGFLAILDLTSNSTAAVMDLDTLGQGIFRVFYHPATDAVYSLNTLGFGSSTGAITSYAIGSRSPVSTELGFTVGALGGIYEDSLYAVFGGNFGGVALPSLSPLSQNIAAGSWAGAAVDTAQFRFFLTETDYFSYGRLNNFDGSGNLVDTIATGISPEALAVDYESTVSRDPILSDQVYITAYPNPAVNELNIDVSRLKAPVLGIELIGTKGNTIVRSSLAGAPLDLSSVPAGMYFLRVRTAKGDYIKPIAKQ